jgi:nitrogen regulatory protein PII
MNTRELITIVAEPTLEEKLLDMLRQMGVTGFTIGRVEGDSSRGWALEDVADGTIVRIECVMSEEKAERVMRELQARFLKHRSIVVWQQTVRVLRPDRFP